MVVTPRQDLIGALHKPALDEAGRLIDDLACRRCGYSLRGLLPGGVCPECSTPVGRSIHGDLLQFSDPNWVMRIARGGSVLAASIVLIILVPLAALVLAPNAFGLLLVAMAIPKVVQIIGIWLVTEPDPALQHRESPLSARTLARYGSIIAAGLAIAGYMAGGRTSSTIAALLPGPAGSSSAFRAAAQLLVAALTIGSMIALLRYARTLAWRLPDERLVRQCAGVGLCLAIILGGKAVLDAYFMVTGSQPRRGGAFSSLLGAINFAARFGALVCMWWCIALIFKFRNQLSHVAHLARETWARPL